MSLVCHFYVTCMYSYVIRMSFICTCMSSICHSYVFIKQKILQSPGTILHFKYLGKRKNKLKKSEIEAKMIIKMKKHSLCSNWQIVFMTRRCGYVIPMSLLCTRMTSVCQSYMVLP